MTKIQELAKKVQDLALDETCPICHGKGLIDCPEHGAELDAEGWCAICSTPMDGGPVGVVGCPCNWE